MWKVNLKIFVAFCVFMIELMGPAAEGKLITVDDDAPANFINIQPAIDYASNGDEIEVRPGTYYEAIDFGGKAIRLYSSGGPDVTIIDGTGNYHVVQCVSGEDANTILEGFTITGGNANGPDPNDKCGGGMYCESSNPTVTNCEFLSNNASWDGGGMFNALSSPTVTDCNFINNTAARSGGGMYSQNDSNSILTNCTFSGNEAQGTTIDSGGGGMYNSSSSPTLTNCTFTINWAPHYGGGGMYNNDNSSPTLTNCTFTVNWAPNYGGGMYNNDNSNPTVINCNFSEHEAYMGGGIYNNQSSSPTLTNCTFYNNTADVGGGMFNNNGSNPTVTNCILWGNTPDQIKDWDSPASTTSVSFSDVQGVVWPGPVNIDADPLFVDAAGGDLRLSSSASPCIDHGYNAPYLPATDLTGNPRIVDGDRNGTATVDMGAYELQALPIHNITQNRWYEIIQAAIDDATNGDEIEVGPGTYNEAINFDGRAIRLYSSGGPDVTTIDANGIAGAYHVVQCVSGEDANTILEGFTITGGRANGPYPDSRGGGMYNEYTSPTVTNCIFTNNSATGGGGVFNMQGNTRLSGCTFSFNSATSESGGLHNHECDAIVTNCTFVGNTSVFGGAMSNPYSSPTVSNCTFLANTASEKGGGMYNRSGSTPMVTNCTFNSNLAQTYGGGMYNDNTSSPSVTNCNFSENEAYRGGGMFNNNACSPTVTNCMFSGNSAGWNGGGMYNITNSSPTVTNCTFTGNTASSDTYGGGGMFNHTSSNPIMTNCTFSGNTATTDGGGIYNYNASSPSVTNCILWGDTPDEIFNDGTSSSTVTYSDVQGGLGNGSNIDEDPCFVDVNNPDPNLWSIRLKPDSLCIDAGNTTALPTGVFVDADGNPRVLDDPQTTDTGISILGVTVDMGAYEFHPCLIAGDINCDGVVDFKDVAILCNNWLAGTEPEL